MLQYQLNIINPPSTTSHLYHTLSKKSLATPAVSGKHQTESCIPNES